MLVVNASPLIFLGNAGKLELLRSVGATRIVVPNVVFAEVTGSTHVDVAARALAAVEWLERLPAPPIPPSVLAWDLGLGESAVIATALMTAGSVVVLDDLSARKCARSLGLEVMGTLGVVIAARRRGAVADAREVLSELRASGMWLSDRVLDLALELAGEKE